MLFQKLLKPASAAAGIQYVGAATSSGATSGGTVTVSLTGLTGGIASSAAIGDVVVISIGVAGSTSIPAIPTVSGYTQVASTGAADTNATRIYTGYKVLTSADTSVSYTWVASNGSSTAYVSVWRNVDATYPLDVAAQSIGTQNTVLANPPAITPITSGAYILASGAGAHTRGSGATYASSNLTDFRSTAISNTYDSIIGGGYNQWTSGTFDPAAFTFSGGLDSSTYSNASSTIALRPTGKTYPTVVASASDSGGSVTVPAHQAGDWIVFVNGRAFLTTAPALTSGFTDILTFNNDNSSTFDRAARAQYIVSDGTITTLSCSDFGSVAILRNVTSLLSTKTASTTSATNTSSISVTMTPTVPGSICLFAGYDGGSTSGATTITYVSGFGGYATSGALVPAISGALTFSPTVLPCYCGIEFI